MNDKMKDSVLTMAECKFYEFLEKAAKKDEVWDEDGVFAAKAALKAIVQIMTIEKAKQEGHK